MTDYDVQQILQEIIELAHLLGWSTALAQDKNEVMLGMYIGETAWIDAKIGNKEQKTTH